MYLLDTNICIALMNENRQAIAQFNRMFPQCYTSTLVIAELYKGIYGSQQFQRNMESLTELTELLSIKSFDTAAAEEFGKIQSELKQIGKPTGEIDALIAAVARSHKDIVVTDNVATLKTLLVYNSKTG